MKNRRFKDAECAEEVRNRGTNRWLEQDPNRGSSRGKQGGTSGAPRLQEEAPGSTEARADKCILRRGGEPLYRAQSTSRPSQLGVGPGGRPNCPGPTRAGRPGLVVGPVPWPSVPLCPPANLNNLLLAGGGDLREVVP